MSVPGLKDWNLCADISSNWTPSTLVRKCLATGMFYDLSLKAIKSLSEIIIFLPVAFYTHRIVGWYILTGFQIMGLND